MPRTNQALKRAPNGAISDKPIALRLLPPELSAVKTLASHEQRSMASVARLVLLRGLAEIEKDPQHRLVL